MKALDVSSELKKLGWETRRTMPHNARAAVTMHRQSATGTMQFLTISKKGQIFSCDRKKINELEDKK